MYLEYKGLFARVRNRYFRNIVRRLKDEGCTNLLDYGCGPGDMLLICAEEDLPATGIDKFARSVEMAAARGLRVLQGDERCPDLAPESYDAIFMQSVLEHLADPIPVLQRLIVALRPGGTLVLSSPTPGGDFWNDPTHVRPYTPRSFRVLADLLGLKAVEVNYVFSFLLGVRLESSLVYKTLNLVPFSLGSNLIGFFRKPHHGAG